MRAVNVLGKMTLGAAVHTSVAVLSLAPSLTSDTHAVRITYVSHLSSRKIPRKKSAMKPIHNELVLLAICNHDQNAADGVGTFVPDMLYSYTWTPILESKVFVIWVQFLRQDRDNF